MDETEEETGGTAPDPKKKKNFLRVDRAAGFRPCWGHVVGSDGALRHLRQGGAGERGAVAASKVWKRVPMPLITVRLALAEIASKDVPVPDSGGLVLAGQVEAFIGVAGVVDGTQAVSVFLMNLRPADEAPAFRIACTCLRSS